MSDKFRASAQERLVKHVQVLERLAGEKRDASATLIEAFKDAENDGFDPSTLKIVLKLRELTPWQRKERRALEAIYLAHLGMLDGDPLTDEARKRLDGDEKDPDEKDPDEKDQSASPSSSAPDDAEAPSDGSAPASPAQPSLALKEPSEARQEGQDAAAAGKRIYDNPFPAGDPCRAAWDEGWCAQRKSHGMEAPTAYQRRTEKPEDKPGNDATAPAEKGDA